MKHFSIWGALFVLPILLLLAVGATPPDQSSIDVSRFLIAGVALSAIHPTLLDFKSRLDPDNSIATIIEILNQFNPVLDNMVWVEGNLLTGHQTTIRTGIPAPTWRKLYGGVQPSKSTTAKVTDACGMLESYAEVDKALADLNGNAPAWRLSEDRAFIEGMSQELASSVFYANEATAPEEITGLTPRYNSSTAASADNVIAHGGVQSDNTSIWLVVWGTNTIHGIYPKGSQAGLQFRDLGEVTKENIDGAGGMAQMYRSHYRWDAGLTVRDWRYAARVANIDISTLLTLSATKDLITSMIMASERIPSFGNGRASWYVNRYIREKLRLGIVEKIATNLTWETVAGRRVMMFDGIPVERTDALVNNEPLYA